VARVNTGSTVCQGETHEGGAARALTPEQELRRSLMACLLWEDGFYEDGKSIADRLSALVALVPADKVAALAREARTAMRLRHAPLLIVREMARASAAHRHLVADTLENVIQRADELSEFVALYWKDKKQPLSAQAKKGLARAFRKFDAYQLAKYNRDTPVKLRDVLFLCHAKPKDKEQEATWKALVDGTLPAPDTWEVALSAGADKREAWTRILTEQKLGPLALIRNLRNMTEAKVDDAAIRSALVSMKADRVLPFRFIAAARIMPRFVGELETAMLRNLEGQTKLGGMTAVLVDVSGSMDEKLSAKSDMTRMDAAAGLAVFAREICALVRVFTFSDFLAEVPAYRGLALVDAIQKSQPHHSTMLGAAVNTVNQQTPYDRLIVITDEQSHDRVPGPNGRGFVINVSVNKPGIGYGAWQHIDGWSERVLDYIRAIEQ
jgi:60 kDa SS-A/Ro ribonucleoprotein